MFEWTSVKDHVCQDGRHSQKWWPGGLISFSIYSLLLYYVMFIMETGGKTPGLGVARRGLTGQGRVEVLIF